MKKSLYILLPVHNRKAITERFIDCLASQTFQDYQLVLIDDGCTDGTADMVLERLPSAVMLNGDGNLWWAGSLQAGYEWLLSQELSPNDVILIINDDVGFKEDFLEIGMELIRASKKSLLQAIAIGNEGQVVDRGVNVNWREYKFRGAENTEMINCLSTRGLFLRMEDFETIGGFHPKLLPHYGSDYEFTIRARRKGFNLAVNEKLYLLMNEYSTGVRKFKSRHMRDYCSHFFSKRSTLNPFYQTMFVVLASDRFVMPLNILRVWVNFLRQSFAYIFHSFAHLVSKNFK